MTSFQQLSQFRRNDSYSLSYRIRFAFWFFSGRPLLASIFPGTLWRKQVLRLFGANIGSGGRLKPRLHITCPWNLVIGSHCWIGESSWIDNLAPVVIGDNVCLSQGAYLCTGNHDYRSISFNLRLGPILIEDEVWIGARAIVAPGSHICSGAVIAIGAVVSKKVPAGVIVRGNPAQIIGSR